MDYDSNLIRFFILAPILPGSITLYVLFRKRFYREIPTFVAYLLVMVVGAIIVFVVYQRGTQWNYFYSAHFHDGLAIVVAFLVIIDVFRSAIADYDAIRQTGTVFLIIVGVGLLALAAGVGYLVPTHLDPFVRSIMTLERSVRIVQVGLIVAIFAFSSFLGLSWRHHVFGIALGFGLYAAANMALIAFVAEIGSTVAYKSLIIDQSVYLCTAITWMVYVLQAHPRQLANIPATSRPELERWNQALSELLHR